MNLWSWLPGRSGQKAAGLWADDGAYTALVNAILGGSVTSKSGATVSRDTAFRVAVVFACLRVLSEGVAQVPFKVMRKTASTGSRESDHREATAHPLYDLLHAAPNGWQTSFEFREQMVLHAALCGRAHAFKNVVSIGSAGSVITELILLDPLRVKVKQQKDWSLVYEVRSADGSEAQVFPQESIWTVRGPSWDGVIGLDVLNLARDAIGLSISTEESHAKLHAKGVRPSGVYSVDGKLDAKQYDALKKWVTQEFAGAENTGIPMILDSGAKWVTQTMNGVDAQHMETRLHQITEICRFFRVLPLMVGHSDKTQTFASAEQMFLAHVVHTLMPWYERIQQSAAVNLLNKAERADGYYVKLLEAGLLRGAMKDTSEYLTKLSDRGIMTRNEARNKLDLNPLDGLDEPLTPTNMTTDPSGAVAEPTPAGA